MTWWNVAYGVVTVVTGALTAKSQYDTGQEQERYHNYLSESARIQGEWAMRMANKKSELIQGAASAKGKQQKLEAARVAALQKAAISSNGFDFLSVTSENLLGETYKTAKEDELNIRFNADAETWTVMENAKYEQWAQNEESMAQSAMAANASRQANMKMTGTLLGTAASVIGIASKAGAFAGGDGGVGFGTEGSMTTLTSRGNARIISTTLR